MTWLTQATDKEKFNPNHEIDFVESDYRQDLSVTFKINYLYMKKTQVIILLFIIGIADAYMVSHPNLLGKIGVRVYNYSMFKTFPNALLTILGSLTISYILCSFLQKKAGLKWAKYLLTFCLVISILVLIQVFLKFSGGSYAHTGKVFKFGLHLFPILLIYIFGNGLWEWIRNSRIDNK